jgi:hypothetical protein
LNDRFHKCEFDVAKLQNPSVFKSDKCYSTIFLTNTTAKQNMFIFATLLTGKRMLTFFNKNNGCALVTKAKLTQLMTRAQRATA